MYLLKPYMYFLFQNTNNLNLFARQYGFRKDHSTTDAIMNLVGDILKSFDKDLMVLSVFIDMRKAFDTVPHDRVWQKLARLGVEDTELKWFISYMSGHRQFVDLNGIQSVKQNCQIGVAQGSLLGVLIFQCYLIEKGSFPTYT